MNGISMIPKNEKGIALIVSILFLTLICLLGLAGILTSTTDIKIATNSMSNAKAFHITEAGINHAILRLRLINASSGSPYNFSDELVTAASTDGLLGSYLNPGDDNPLVSLSFGDGSYVVYLQNDSSQGRTTITDSNMRATLTSIGSGPGKSEKVIQADIRIYTIGPPPAAITMIGSNATFIGGTSSAKKLSGDDNCGSYPSRPVIGVTDGSSKTSVQNAVNASHPSTYSTSYAGGAVDDIVASGKLSNIKTKYEFDFMSVNDLKALVAHMEGSADSIVSSGGTADLGSVGNEKIVVVNGDFSMSGVAGAGILVVKGNLTFNGSISYDGLILAVGTGSIIWQGSGTGTIQGGIVVADTVGPDGISGTGDDTIGSGPVLNASGSGNAQILYCPSAVHKAFFKLPLIREAWREVIEE